MQAKRVFLFRNWETSYTQPMEKRLTAALFTVACLIFYSGFRMPFQSPKILGILILFVFLIRFRPPRWPGILPTLLFLWPLVTAVLVTNWLDYLQAIMLAALYWSALWLDLDQERKQAIRLGLAFAGIGCSAYLILQTLGWDWIEWQTGSAAGGVFGNPNGSAHFLLLAIFLGRMPSRYLDHLARALMLPGLILCHSRGAFLAFGLGALFLLWTETRTRKLVLPLTAILLTFGILSQWMEIRTGLIHLRNPTAWSDAYEKGPLTLGDQRQLEDALARGQEISPQQALALKEVPPWFKGKRLSLMLREILWGNSFFLAREHFWLGAGAGQFHVQYPAMSRVWVADISMGGAYRAESAHNFLLDSVIQLGFPWLCGMLFFLFFLIKDAEQDLRLATALQLLIALFSLNYLSPVIVITLLLLLPRPFSPSKPARLPPALIIIGILALLFLDLKPLPLPPLLAPEQHARQAYERGDYERALGLQVRAWEQDPYGPETLFNLAMIAAQTQSGGELSANALALIRKEFPNYEPAREYLNQLNPKVSGASQLESPGFEGFSLLVGDLKRSLGGNQ